MEKELLAESGEQPGVSREPWRQRLLYEGAIDCSCRDDLTDWLDGQEYKVLQDVCQSINFDSDREARGAEG